MKIAIDLGHGVGSDRGAVGLRNEEELINATGKELIPLLTAAGHSIKQVRPSSAGSVNDSLKQRVAAANNWGADLFISIHYNAFNGSASGEEVFATSDIGRKFAQAVSLNLASLGFKNRGVKDGSKLYVVKHTNMPAILIEACFIDSADDVAKFNPALIAQAIADGVAKGVLN